MSLSNSSESRIPRRILLQSAAAFCTLRLAGCGLATAVQQEENSEAPKKSATHEESEPKDAFVDQGYRLYGVVPEDEATFMAKTFRTIKPAPIYVSPISGWRHQPVKDDTPKPAFTWAIWATKEEAETVSAMDGVKKLLEKKPEHIHVSGSPDKVPDEATGKLSAIFATTARNSTMTAESSRTLQQIADELKAATKDFRGVKISVLAREQRADFAIGDIPVDQIIIEFTTMRLSEDVLKLIKEHPQAIQIKWDGMFTEFYCPGCGMG